MKRQYTKLKHLEESVFQLKGEGKTREEIAKILGLSFVQVKNLINRHNRRKRTMDIPISRRRRPRKTPLAERERLEQENRRLKMENDLLRSFLQVAGRGRDPK